MTNLDKAKKAGWEFFKEINHWTGFKNGGTERNCTTKACVNKEEAANEALNIDYLYHRKKECHVWVETDDPAKGGKQGGNFVKISPPLTQETAETVANLYRMEHPEQDFIVSIGKPSSYFL